jgi:hypothetical protein
LWWWEEEEATDSDSLPPWRRVAREPNRLIAGGF